MSEVMYLIYQGSVYDHHKRIPNEHYIMDEDEWEERVKLNQTGNAVVLQRGMTFEVADKMCRLAMANEG